MKRIFMLLCVLCLSIADVSAYSINAPTFDFSLSTTSGQFGVQYYHDSQIVGGGIPELVVLRGYRGQKLFQFNDPSLWIPCCAVLLTAAIALGASQIKNRSSPK